jgi:hypothetical protein
LTSSLSYVGQELQFLPEETKKAGKDYIQKKAHECQQKKGKLDKMLQQLNNLGTEYDESTLAEIIQKTANRKRKTVVDLLADQNFEQFCKSRLTAEQHSSLTAMREACERAMSAYEEGIIAHSKKLKSPPSVSNSSSKVC